MSPSNIGALAVIGGSGSGKSTWLGSVLEGISLGNSQVLEEPPEGFPTNARAIEVLTDALVDARYPKHTPTDQQLELELGLRARHEAFGTRDFQLVVSDYGGEQLDHLFEHRVSGWGQSWRARAEVASLLLFIRPDANPPLPRTVQIEEANPWARALSEDRLLPRPSLLGPTTPGEIFTTIDDEVPIVPSPGPRDPVRVPGVLALVEMLQFLRAERGLRLGQRPAPGTMRVAIVVSAWDAVPEEWQRKGPNHYLAEHMPLLEEFMWSNFAADDVFRFAVSATGGDLNDAAYREQYRDEPRGWCEWAGLDGSIVRTHELSLPLLWTLFGDRALSLGDHLR